MTGALGDWGIVNQKHRPVSQLSQRAASAHLVGACWVLGTGPVRRFLSSVLPAGLQIIASGSSSLSSLTSVTLSTLSTLISLRLRWLFTAGVAGWAPSFCDRR